MTDRDSLGFATRAIHAAFEPNPNTGAIIPSIDLSVTFEVDEPGNPSTGYEYSRVGNPNRHLLERQLASLEDAAHAITFATGLAAEDALLRCLLAPGDTIVLGDDVYGGTYRLLTGTFVRWGVRVEVVDASDLDAVAQAVATHAPKVIWLETPSNPLMKITDIRGVAELSGDALVVVDGTFATPYLQRPLELGADVVVHSTTKYLGGHSDVMGGVVVTNSDQIAADVALHQASAGAVLSPFEAWLTMRGVKTLAVRMDAHCANAAAIAEALSRDPRVTALYYPGLPDHPGHALAAAQMSHFGGMLSLELATEAQAREFLASTRLFSLAGSLGSIDSLVNHPATMTHAALQGTPLEISPCVVRLSVGIESIGDLLADIDQALSRAVGAAEA
jgi:cystathionine gamma-synthase